MNKLEIFNDDEFKSLDTEKKNQVLTNYFNTNLADDAYKSLDSEKQTSILQNFISSQLIPDKEPKKENTFIDKAKEFGKNYLDDVADTFIGARPFGTEDKAKDLKDKVFENVFGGLGGVQEAKSLDLKLENKEDAQQQEKLKIAQDNKNYEKIDDSLIRSIEGLARTDIRLIGEATDEQKNDYLKNVAGILGKGGYALGQNDKGEYIAVDKQGNEKSITNDFFGGLLDTIVADAGEISGAMYGAKKGLEASKNIKNPLLKVGAVATSSAMGAMTGTALDTAINELRGNQNLGVVDYLNEMSKSAVLDAVGSAVGYGIIKVGGKIVELPKQARDYILNGNLNGAREILKKDLKIDEQFIEDALQQAQNNYKEVGEYANKGLTDKSRQQEELLAATLEKGDANIIKGAISTNETAARNLADTIDKRATNIYDELEKKSSKVGGEEIKNYLNSFENTTKQNFSNMRKDFDEAFKEVDYKFELEDLGLNSVFKDMSKRVQDPDAKQRFLTLQTAIKNTIYDSNAQVGIERDINGLLDLRQQLNKFYGQNERYLANKKDKDTFNSLKENIDNQIYKAVNDNLPEEVGTRLMDSFNKSMQGYRELGALQENKVFTGIMGDAKNPEFRMDSLVKHMADDDSYVDDVLSKMTPNSRQTVEVAVIRDITNSYTAKTAQGQKAIAFEDLGKELQTIKRNVRSELGKETIDNLITYADKFGNKDLLYLDMAKGIATKPKHNISTTLEGKIKMETASMLFQIVQTLKPGDDAKRLALQRHIGQALEKSRTPNEFATSIYEYPDLADDSRQILKTLIKNNNKVLAAKNDQEAEALLKQVEVENNKIFEEQNKLKEQIENFKTPDIYEIKTVTGLTPDDRFGSFSQMTTKIQNGTATQAEIEQYLKAKNKIEPEALEKNILKLKYPENAFSVYKLNDLKSFVNEKVNEIISENEFKALIYNLDKYNKLPNTTPEIESKYRDKFYKLNKLYDEEKALQEKAKIEAENKAFEDADKNGIIPFAKFSDNLLAGAVAGVQTDEDGNIVGFDPEAFVIGLGGYTVAKASAKKLMATYGDKIKENVAKKLDNFIASAEDDMAKMAGGGKPPVIEKSFKDDQGFYSLLEKTIDEKVGGKIDSVSLTKMLEKNGVKQDEIEWSGLKNLLENQDKVTKKEIEETLIENRLVLEKVEKDIHKSSILKQISEVREKLKKLTLSRETEKEIAELMDEQSRLEKIYNMDIKTFRYGSFKLDGGENYREMLFRMPNKVEAKLGEDSKIIDGGDGYYYLENAPFDGTNVVSSAKSKATLENQIKKGYKSDHWDESNIVVFTRVDDRTIDNKKTLFMEELQSDWHQDGRKKGYGNRSPKVPNAPFKKNWHELGLKRMIQEAVEKDYDKIAWTTGKQQTQRYSLEKEIDTVIYNKESGYLQASKDGNEVIFKKVVNDEEVSTLLGKELTTRLIDPKHSTRDNIFVIKGEETKFGGDGMKTFYDEIVPNTAKKLLKKYNVKPKLEELDEIEEMVWSIEITPKMKEDIKKYGQPLYAVAPAIIGNELINGEIND